MQAITFKCNVLGEVVDTLYTDVYVLRILCAYLVFFPFLFTFYFVGLKLLLKLH
jgi:hypothetical protein